jgi:hypothetical protein
MTPFRVEPGGGPRGCDIGRPRRRAQGSGLVAGQGRAEREAGGEGREQKTPQAQAAAPAPSGRETGLAEHDADRRGQKRGREG